jgi:hypothetical protein
MKLIIFIAAIFCTLLLGGCVTPPPSSEGFHPIANPSTFVLTERMVVLQKPAPLAVRPAEVSLAEGTYVAEQENDSGTLFRGPPGCVMFEHASGYRVGSGGLWIPKSPSLLSRMYFYAYTDSRNYRDRASALAGASGELVSGSIGTADPKVVVVPFGPGANTGPVIAGAGIGSGIVSAIMAADVRNYRGKPVFLWEVSSPELVALRKRLERALITAAPQPVKKNLECSMKSSFNSQFDTDACGAGQLSR